MKLPHFHHSKHHLIGQPRVMIAPLPPRINPQVSTVDIEPEGIAFGFNDGSRAYIWSGRPLAHQANVYLPDGRVVYLRPGKSSSDSLAELYLRLAYRYIEGCIHDHSDMLKHEVVYLDGISEVHRIHRLFHTPFIWRTLNYDTP